MVATAGVVSASVTAPAAAIRVTGPASQPVRMPLRQRLRCSPLEYSPLEVWRWHADVARELGRRAERDVGRPVAQPEAAECARRRTAREPWLVDAHSQSEQTLIVAQAVQVAARITVLAREDSRGGERPGALDVQHGVTATLLWTTPGDHGRSGRRCA